MNCIRVARPGDHGHETVGFHTIHEIVTEEILASLWRLSFLDLVPITHVATDYTP